MWFSLSKEFKCYKVLVHVHAAYRFYKTKCEEDSIKHRGKTAEKQHKKHARERLMRVSTPNFCFYVKFISYFAIET